MSLVSAVSEHKDKAVSLRVTQAGGVDVADSVLVYVGLSEVLSHLDVPAFQLQRFGQRVRAELEESFFWRLWRCSKHVQCFHSIFCKYYEKCFFY